MDMFTQVHLTFLKVTIVCGVLLFEMFVDWHKNVSCTNNHFSTQQKMSNLSCSTMTSCHSYTVFLCLLFS